MIIIRKWNIVFLGKIYHLSDLDDLLLFLMFQMKQKKYIGCFIFVYKINNLSENWL